VISNVTFTPYPSLPVSANSNIIKIEKDAVSFGNNKAPKNWLLWNFICPHAFARP
jgi:hypothetical protein